MSYKLQRDESLATYQYDGVIYYYVGTGSKELAECAKDYRFQIYERSKYFGEMKIAEGSHPCLFYYVKKEDFERVEQLQQMNTPTKEQIQEAANTSPEAKAALTKLFPDYFPKPIKRVSNEQIEEYNRQHGNTVYTLIGDMGGRRDLTCYSFLNVVDFGEYEGRGFLLSAGKHHQQFEIITDDGGFQILVPVIQNK